MSDENFDDLFIGLGDHEKLPVADPRGILAYRTYPDELQRRMDARQYVDHAYKITQRDATDLEVAFIKHLGYVDHAEQKPIHARILWRRGVREIHYHYTNGNEITDAES